MDNRKRGNRFFPAKGVNFFAYQDALFPIIGAETEASFTDLVINSIFDIPTTQDKKCFAVIRVKDKKFLVANQEINPTNLKVGHKITSFKLKSIGTKVVTFLGRDLAKQEIKVNVPVFELISPIGYVE